MAGESGAQSRMLIDTSAPDGSSFWAEFLSETIVQEIPILNTAGQRGTRAHASERNRRGNERAFGSITFEASRVLLDNLLPGALGGSESANVFNVAEALPSLYFLIDKGYDIALVSEAKIGRIAFSGTQGQIVQLTCDIEAESITWGQSWPNGPVPDISKPYFFSDLGNVTLNASARKVFDFEVTVDNSLVADQWGNQLTRSGTIFAGDRIVTTRITVPSTTANQDLKSSSVTGNAVSFVLTNADETDSVLTIALGRAAFDQATTKVGGKGQLVLQLTGQSRAAGHAGATAPDIRITNAHAA